MKTSKALLTSTPLARKLGACLAAIATVALVGLGAASLNVPAYARPGHEHGDRGDLEELRAVLQKAQMEELLQLASDFHGAISYGGNITALMSLWADKSSITFNGTPYVGKDAVQAFFLSTGYFKNNWVSLAPEYKTVVTVHGNTGHISTQCVAIDLTVSPMVVKGITQLEGDVVRQGDKWLFKAVIGTSPAPL